MSARKSDGQGSQSLRRAIAILRTLSQGTAEGMKLTEVAEKNGLHVATAHRLLKALAEEGLVLAVSANKTYRLGAEIRRLGLCAERQSGLERAFAPVLERVADLTQDTVFLSIRSGANAVCLARKQGAYPVRTLILDVGSVRPLGVGAGSLALCAYLPAEEIEEILDRNAEAYRDYNLTRTEVAELIRRAREEGYATNDGRVIPEYTGVGVLIRRRSALAEVSISVAAVNSRMAPERRHWIAKTIRTAEAEFADDEPQAGGILADEIWKSGEIRDSEHD